MASNATANRLNSRWKQAPLLGPGGIIGIGVALAVVLMVTLILSFIWWKMMNQPEPEEHNAELPHDHQPPLPELPQRDFHAGEAATDCPVCLEEFVEGESLVELPTCLHAFHPACIQMWLTRNHASCPVCRLHLGLQVDSVV